MEWDAMTIGAVSGFVAVFLERLAEEASPDTPVIGRYRGLIRAVARALLPRARKRPDPSPKDKG